MAASVSIYLAQVCVVLLLLTLSFQSLRAAAETRGNYYEILQVEPTASASEIKKSFRKLALKFHPDKSNGADAEKRFREALEAYQVLSNKEKRRLYDREGHATFQQASSPADPMDEQVDDLLFTFSDLFHDSDSPFFEQPGPYWTFDDFEDEDEFFRPHCSSDSFVFVENEFEDLFY